MNTVRHGRTVNRIVWNTINEAWLLSAGQDGICHLWDTRCTGIQSHPNYNQIANLHNTLENLSISSATSNSMMMSTNSMVSFSTGIDAVRDIQFDPFNPLIFSSAAEDGCIYTWDIRKSNIPIQSTTAHVGLISTLAYHPTIPGIIATGGRDRLVKIWNIGNHCIHNNSVYDQFINQWNTKLSTKNNQSLSTNLKTNETSEHITTIQTMASVARLNWRLSSIHPWIPYETNENNPLSLSNINNNTKNSALQYHLATCAALLDNISYVWDIRYPNIPVAMFYGHRDVVTGLIWTDPEINDTIEPISVPDTPIRPWLITSSKDGAVCIHNPKYAERPHMTLRTTTLAVSSRGMAFSHHSIQRDAYWDNNNSSVVVPLSPQTNNSGPKSVVNKFYVKDESSQLPSVAHLLDPPVSVFTRLATEYRTEGAPIDVLCMHNANIALEVKAYDLCRMWKILHILYKPRPPVSQLRKQKQFAEIVQRHKLQFVSNKVTESETKPTEQDIANMSIDNGDAVTIDNNTPQETTNMDSTVEEKNITIEIDPITVDVYDSNPIPGYIIGLMESLTKVNPDAARYWNSSESLSFMENFPMLTNEGFESKTMNNQLDSGMVHKIDNKANEDSYSFTSFFKPGGIDSATLQEKDWETMRLRIVEDILRYYAEQGDVQTCVTVSRIIGPTIEERIGKRLLQQWLVQYIDQLHQLELWSPASIVMARASDEGVRRLNQLSTSVISACGTCTQDAVQSSIPDVMPRSNNDTSISTSLNTKIFYTDNEIYSINGRTIDTKVHHHDTLITTDEPIIATNIGVLQAVGATQCRSCASEISTCSICQEPVKGLYTWCEGCGHGGHVHHIHEWFKTSTLCPAGCMHVCLLN